MYFLRADSIKGVLGRVLTYFKNTEYKIIDRKTGKEITDFSQLNKNADWLPVKIMIFIHMVV